MSTQQEKVYEGKDLKCKKCKTIFKASSEVFTIFKICQNCISHRANKILSLNKIDHLTEVVAIENSTKIYEGTYVHFYIGDLIFLKEGLLFLEYKSGSVEKDVEWKNAATYHVQKAKYLRQILKQFPLTFQLGLLKDSKFFPSWEVVGINPLNTKVFTEDTAKITIVIDRDGDIEGLDFFLNVPHVETVLDKLAEWSLYINDLNKQRFGLVDEISEQLTYLLSKKSYEISSLTKEKLEIICDDSLQTRYLAKKLVRPRGSLFIRGWLSRYNRTRQILRLRMESDKLKVFKKTILEMSKKDVNNLFVVGGFLLFFLGGSLSYPSLYFMNSNNKSGSYGFKGLVENFIYPYLWIIDFSLIFVGFLVLGFSFKWYYFLRQKNVELNKDK